MLQTQYRTTNLDAIFDSNAPLQPIFEEQHVEGEKLLIFALHHEWYALPILQTKEVLEYKLGALTPVPGAPAVIAGLRNVKGRILTIIETHLLFGLPAADVGLNSRIIVVEGSRYSAGLLANEVPEILEDVRPETIESAGDASYLRGRITQSDGRIIGIVNLDALLDGVARHNQ